MSVKQETSSSGSQSPFMNVDHGVVLDESLPNSASCSKMSTPPPSTAASTSKKASPSAPQLIGDLPIARDEALGTFVEMSNNWYQYKSLGRSRELMESMTCECQFSHGDDPDSACGPSSDCINRLTQVECLPDDCRCGEYCRNQRFQKKEYAPIEIVKTEKKGYGLRVEEDIERDTFIYEYVGDVVNTQSFKKRMRDYANEGIEHFYFMMLQKDEFIDATKNGGIGRFANHSCNPNCYVAKWTLGRTVRMGIFSKRKIRKHEELTFNYNVDRYGHQAQTCYCGEANCVGFIGGKTQTDISSMDDLYLDALGITDENDLLEMKGTKKKKGKKIDDPDFMPQMKTIVEKDVPKVVQALRQVQSKKVLYKLLTRIKITEDEPALRQIMRLRGFSIMKNILDDYAEDIDIIALALQCMKSWPLVARNKVEDSQVLPTVQGFIESQDELVKVHAAQLCEHWLSLELAYRIPKRNLEEPEKKTWTSWSESYVGGPSKRSRFIDADDNGNPLTAVPKTFFRSRSTYTPPPPPRSRPRPPSPPRINLHHQMLFEQKQKQNAAVNNLIASVAEEQASAEAAAAAALEAAKAEAEATKQSSNGAEGSVSKKREKERKKSSQSEAEKEANKEKRLHKLVGAVVVKCMSKYAHSIEHDLFKKYAKELTEKIAEREKKSSAYKEGKLDSLSEEKTAKIKKYAKEYITSKVLRKANKSGRHKSRSSSSVIKQETPSDVTPNSADLNPAMVDLDVDDDSDVDMDMDQDSDGEGGRVKIEEDENGINPYVHPSMDLNRSFKKEEDRLDAEAWLQRLPTWEEASRSETELS
ncbi:hypothetical protein E1B28_013634 [Marasmius oreades]|uniref:Histone-lysine N-methyltransferase, H3 lysine-36 specific n=1 Tax=Marasmius oreades TaxID=181124 RepID=A0A9P7RQ76_9AGAR|nr:uncharacterized protein E1B28_013634 [Marasmius oreades]KAG7087687.1 hypothetical protein E1B28_013634 [Marasmius oreades]